MAARLATVKVGLVSDTHGLLDPALPALFDGCARVLHAGDVTGPEVLDGLRARFDVVAVRGNNDRGAFGRSLPEAATVDVGGHRALVLHELGKPEKPVRDAAARLAAEAPAIVVYGHSHVPHVELLGGRLYVNPGSAGPRRFRLPRAAGILAVDGDAVTVTVHRLDAPSFPLLVGPVEVPP